MPLVYLLSMSRMNFSYSESASLALILPNPQPPFPHDCYFPKFIILDPVIVYQEICNPIIRIHKHTQAYLFPHYHNIFSSSSSSSSFSASSWNSKTKKKKMKGELGQRRICGLEMMIAIKPCTFASTVSVKAHRFVQRAVPL
jgi:hypothetical protein